MGELKRAAKELGVINSTVLREQVWKLASPAWIEGVEEDPPDWLIVARQRRARNGGVRQRRRDRKRTAWRLCVTERVVKEHDIDPAQVEDLLATRPDWLLAEQSRRRRQIEGYDEDELRRDFTYALVAPIEEAWFQELKSAASDDEAHAIDARRVIEIKRAKREARQLSRPITSKEADEMKRMFGFYDLSAADQATFERWVDASQWTT